MYEYFCFSNNSLYLIYLSMKIDETSMNVIISCENRNCFFLLFLSYMLQYIEYTYVYMYIYIYEFQDCLRTCV